MPRKKPLSSKKLNARTLSSGLIMETTLYRTTASGRKGKKLKTKTQKLSARELSSM